VAARHAFFSGIPLEKHGKNNGSEGEDILNKQKKGYLVGGLDHFLFSHIYWEESSQLTFIFFRGVETTNQM
jgi:hypothetical protein